MMIKKSWVLPIFVILLLISISYIVFGIAPNQIAGVGVILPTNTTIGTNISTARVMFNATTIGNVTVLTFYLRNASGIVFRANGTNLTSDGTMWNYSFDITTLADGYYNFTVNATNISSGDPGGSANTTNGTAGGSLKYWNFTIDHTAPVISLNRSTFQTDFRITPGVSSAANFTFNLSVNELGTRTGFRCSFWVGRRVLSTGLRYWTNGTLGGANYTVSLNASNGNSNLGQIRKFNATHTVINFGRSSSQALWDWNINCTDNSGLNNWLFWNTNASILYDVDDPSDVKATLSKTEAKISDVEIEITCTGSDNIAGNLSYTYYIDGVSIPSKTYEIEDTGDFEATCSAKDWGNHTAMSIPTLFKIITSKVTKEVTYAITAPTVAPGAVANIGSLTEKGAKRSLFKDSSVKFLVEGEDHVALVKNVAENSVTIIISSTPIELTLNVGDVKKVDLNGDGVDDVIVALEEIKDNKAIIEFKKFTAETAKEVKEAPKKEEEKKLLPPITPEEKSKLMWWILVIVVVLAIAGGVYYFKKK